jgi:uncharacterized protein YlxP (DUF503 family)
MFIAAIRLELSLPESGSLKTKRQMLRSLMDKLRSRFGAAVAEVGDQDLWQRAAVGVALVSGDEGHVREMAGKVMDFVASHWEGEVLSMETEIL